MSINRETERVSYGNICASPCTLLYIEAGVLPKPGALESRNTGTKGTNTISSTVKSAFQCTGPSTC